MQQQQTGQASVQEHLNALQPGQHRQAVPNSRLARRRTGSHGGWIEGAPQSVNLPRRRRVSTCAQSTGDLTGTRHTGSAEAGTKLPSCKRSRKRGREHPGRGAFCRLPRVGCSQAEREFDCARHK
ncbi:hypothetical protein MPLB_1990057 [Mesorhizobium sp. ORS 3324]|nr:hypothetical protein MPLB_1990057 [Mesorhizobium sp. ORS 3324]